MEKSIEESLEEISAPSWHLFSHGSDIGVRGVGGTLREAFEQTGLALTGMVTDVQSVQDLQKVSVTCTAPDNELLLMDWLNAVIYEMSSKNMLFSRFEVNLKNLELEASLWGEPVDIKRHSPAVEPKAATFTELKVTQLPTGLWIAQCVIDV